MTLYQNVLKNLSDACEQYRNHCMEITDLKNAVWQAARIITSVQERDLRDVLQQAEGELDMIQFTSENVFGDSLRIVSDITEKIRSMMNPEEKKQDMSLKLNHGEILLWIEPKSGFFIKTVTNSGDSVRLTGEDARKLAQTLVIMADRADKSQVLNP